MSESDSKLHQIRELLLEARADDWYFDQTASKELLLIEEIVFTDTEATRRNGIHK